MKKYLFVLLSITGLCSFTAVSDWVKYTSAQGHFSINFMGTPHESTSVDSSDVTKPMVYHSVDSSPNGSSDIYLIVWYDIGSYDPKTADIKGYLENARDAGVKNINATSVNTTTIETGEHPYIEYTFSSDKYTGKDCLHIEGTTAYSIVTMYLLDKGISDDADKFINSYSYNP